MEGGFTAVVPVEVGGVAETVTVTVAATETVVVDPLVVLVEVGSEPRLQITVVPLFWAWEHVPGLAVAPVIDEFAGSPMLSVKIAPVTGSLKL